MENKVIFDSEEEAYKVCSKLCGLWESDLLMLKKHGYIRKSAVEEWEEFKNMKPEDYCPSPKDIYMMADRAIQELKSEITRLGK